MKHKKIERLIQKRLDRDTNAEEERSLQHHLSHCGDCQQFYQEMVQTEEALGGLIEIYPRYGFNDRVLNTIGFKRGFAWTKAATALACTWLASFLFLAFSPWPGQLLNHVVTSVPALVRLFEKTELVFSSLSHMLIPLAKNSIDSVHPFIGLIFSILFIYFLGRTLQKEAKCKAR